MSGAGIRETGRTPVQRNTFYEAITVWEANTGTTGRNNGARKSGVLL